MALCAGASHPPAVVVRAWSPGSSSRASMAAVKLEMSQDLYLDPRYCPRRLNVFAAPSGGCRTRRSCRSTFTHASPTERILWPGSMPAATGMVRKRWQ